MCIFRRKGSKAEAAFKLQGRKRVCRQAIPCFTKREHNTIAGDLKHI